MLINSNQLTGPIPTSLANLTALTTTDFGYNALYTSDDALITFLNTKDPDWAATQTIAPTGITATSLDNAVIMVSWLPVTYTADAGYYRVLISEAAGGPYTLAGQTTDKATSAVNVSGLTPGTRYYFVVQTVTNVHGNNQNIVESAYSTEATAIAWLQTQVQISGTVLVSGSPLAGVVMSGLPEGTVTDVNGAYSATVDVGFSGTATPLLAGYTFDPLSRTYTNLTMNQTAQDYVAAVVVVPTITVTSPNGEETWAAGSTHVVTWTQTGLTGSVTIDLYKGGVYQKTLGTADATAGSFSWTIGSGETIGTDYEILVWQSGASDDSDAAFTLVHAAKVDFNKDGQEDILWRYYGGGDYQGVNVAWILNDAGMLSPKPLLVGEIHPLAGSTPSAAYRTPIETGSKRISIPERSFKTVLNRGQASIPEPRQVMKDPMDRDRLASPPGKDNIRNKDPRSIPSLRDATRASAGSTGTAKVAGLALNQEVFLTTVTDTAWEIGGTGDFNGDQKTDILWRNYGTGPYQGVNVIWCMNGNAILTETFLTPVTDTNWRIGGTGDFNGDQKTDILWRYYGTGPYQGANVVWCMNGNAILSEVFLTTVTDTTWQIGGTGDFNGDQKTDILWRNYGTGPYQGANVVWQMDGNAILAEAFLTAVTDTAWEIGGTGDFNSDGQTDILWRYYGTSGPYRGASVIWEMNGTGISSEVFLTPVTDTNWRIVNR